MSRSVKDLRDLICVSRLTIRDSDDEALFSGADDDDDDDDVKDQYRGRHVNKQKKGFSDQPNHTSTPDSGFGTSGGHRAEDSQNSDSEFSADPDGRCVAENRSENFTDDISSKVAKVNDARKKKTKKSSRPARKSVSEQPVSGSCRSRPSPSQNNASSDFSRNELLSVSHRRVDTGAVGDRSATPSGAAFAEGHFETLLLYIDGSVVSEWLEQSNGNVSEMAAWCRAGDNYVRFAHFWLSSFSDREKFEIFRLEYGILLDQLAFAFAAGLNCGAVQTRHLSVFLNAVYREYPARLMSSRGAYLFLDILDILSSPKQLHYRRLLSDVRCSTCTPQHIQWILATRSFAIVSVWSSVVNFYKNFNSNEDITNEPCPPGHDIGLDDGLYLHRMYSAIRNGYADVVHYLLKSGKVPPNTYDGERKSLVFYAVVYKQCKILHLLLNQMNNHQLDVNEPAINGNTPLHAATNGGCKELVEELLSCDRINVNACNPLCDNATPLHLAILHGHLEIARLLLSSDADRTMKMGDLTALDAAEQFGQTEIADLLNNDVDV